MVTTEILTTTLRNGRIVLAKEYEGMIVDVIYANRTQPQKKVARLGDDWEVLQSPLSRRFYVAKKEGR